MLPRARVADSAVTLPRADMKWQKRALSSEKEYLEAYLIIYIYCVIGCMLARGLSRLVEVKKTSGHWPGEVCISSRGGDRHRIFTPLSYSWNFVADQVRLWSPKTVAPLAQEREKCRNSPENPSLCDD